MTEIELLNNYNLIHKDAYAMEFKIKFFNSDEKKDVLEGEYKRLRERLIIAEDELSNVLDKSSSYGAWQRMIRQLTEYANQINKAKQGLKLSRNQGLSIQNHLFSMIIIDLSYIGISGLDMIHIPSNLYYTTDYNDAVEIHEVVDFLKAERQLLQDIQSPNYVNLREYLDGFKKRIVAKFISKVPTSPR